MAISSHPTSYYAFLLALFGILLGFEGSGFAQDSVQLTPEQVKAARLAKGIEDAKDLPDCSLARTNKSCRLTIDRERALTTPTVQMYSNQALTVIVKRPKQYERYFLDYQSGQAILSPDVAASIAQGMLPSLSKLVVAHGYDLTRAEQSHADECAAPEITNSAIPAAGAVKDVVEPIWKCLAKLAGQVIPVYESLEPFVAPDTIVPNPPMEDKTKTDKEKLLALEQPISAFLKSEFAVSARISAITGDDGLKKTVDTNLRVADLRAMLELTDLQKSADGVAADLLAYRLRITDLESFDTGFQECKSIGALTREEEKNDPHVECIWLTSKPDDGGVYHNMVTRTVTYSLNSTTWFLTHSRRPPTRPKRNWWRAFL